MLLFNMDAARVNAMEKHGHLQHKKDNSASAAAAQAIKNNAAVVGAQVDTSANVVSAVQAARLDAAVVNESGVEGVGQTPNNQGKAKDQQVTKITSKPTAANRKGQELGKGDGITGILGKGDASAIGGTSANKKAADTLEVGSQHGQKSHAKGWSVEHRSPSKKVSSDHKILESVAETFRCSNSFDALVCAHEHGEKHLQHKEISAN